MARYVPMSPRIYSAEDNPLYRVFLDDKDVSGRCLEACPGGGWVRLVYLDKDGYVKSNGNGGVVHRKWKGRVVVEAIQ